MTTWMVRGERGRFYDTFRDESMVAIGWQEIAADVTPNMSREDITNLYQARVPGLARAAAVAGASQVWKFINTISIDDKVVTYSPGNRTYLYGTVTSASNYRGETAELGLALVRNIAWRQIEISRDRLTTRARNTLGATLTIFKIPDEVAEELRLLSESPNAVSLGNQGEDEIEIDNPEDNFQATSLEGVQHLALEKVKDLVVSLDWDEMQELVAGILRAMGYKTQVSPPGPDRGRDIVASPDGFGFEHPRIVVEVKHRSGQVGAQSLRSFIGGRHPDDRGLFVSTGGFTKEAKYEADRSNVPLTLWDIDTLVRTLIENYEQTDSETKRLIPLKKIYIPA